MVSSVRVMNYTAWQAWEELSMDHLGAPYLCGTRRAYTFVCDSRVGDQKAEIRMHGEEGGPGYQTQQQGTCLGERQEVARVACGPVYHMPQLGYGQEPTQTW